MILSHTLICKIYIFNVNSHSVQVAFATMCLRQFPEMSKSQKKRVRFLPDSLWYSKYLM